ncbi:S24 family peptidase [Vibrio europaeus]|uniref:Transcriptional regulator n=1 Tax=Vibrio europaeus TaxID=300876 RepID=A0A178JA22_9VIBR|nr:helix-turn-helix transcriptional regulator [Vibrio europaeus]MDC5702973.1 helix-turn-helix transcriptional regulator [Vibrio europaeus]MDC5708795.1 helix-turn-helix transcriptional regulator [Vibrio europaeus]MDC5712865.1 helix-turn-helix transcriptional regulator [Vibrio europaeus]MDC5725285.1 helix-turn-helix transcriptional regulator [Vibrio europaeus]MDC5731851.1 helix-turn-helix transcriptional regulator [Vibrio europaeus]
MSNVDEQIDELKMLTNTATNNDLAIKLGKSPSTIQTWRLRGKIPPKVFLKAREISQNGGIAPPPKGYLNLPLYEVEASAGAGSLVVSEEKTSSIVFSEAFISMEIGVKANNIFLMPVKGDSMQPTLKNGALVMVNKVDRFTGDGVYVFRFDNQLMVKRLQFSKSGLEVLSDNESYKPWELTKEEIQSNDFQIIGEVVWSGQRM